MKKSVTARLVIVAMLTAIFSMGFASVSLAATENLFAGKTGSSANDGVSYELGTRFVSDASGAITGIKVYGVTGESGDHTVRFWNNASGTLAGGPFTFNFTGTNAWVTYTLPSPVYINANVEYTLSVSTGTDSQKYYSYKASDVAVAGSNGSHLSWPANAGVYSTSLGSRPTASSNGNNYLRDIIFDPDAASTPISPSAWPSASNTGVPAGTALTPHTGVISIYTDNTVIDGWQVTGAIDVYANNVTIRNSKIDSNSWWGINLRSGASNLTVVNCTITGIAGAGPDNGGEDYGISFSGTGTFEASYNNISGFANGISTGHGYIHDNYIHDLSAFVNLGGEYAHTQAIYYGGNDAAGLNIQHNTLLNPQSITQGATASIGLFADYGSSHNVTVNDNWMAGGTYALYAGANGSDHITITNNVFSQQYWPSSGYYGAYAYWDPSGVGNVWSNNRYNSGTTIY